MSANFWLRTLALLLLGTPPALAQLHPAHVAGLRVTRLEVQNESRVPDSEIAELFLQRVGEPYDPKMVQRSLGLLGQKTEIANVVVHGEPDGDGVALRLEVKAAPLVRSIRFRGNRAVQASRLLSRLDTRIDRPLREAAAARDTAAIAQVYETEGFPEARATQRAEPDSTGHWVRVVFEIEEGPPRRILHVEIPDGLPVERDRVLALLGLREGDAASRRRLREGVRLLTDVLWREGFLEAQVERARFRPEGDGVVLVLPLRVGEPMDVLFEGIDEWAARPLREVARSRYGQPIDQTWVQRVAGQMVESLRAEGYRNAEVVPALGHRYGRRRVTFEVRRGPRVHVDRVKFEGNDSIKSRQLRKYMSLVQGGILRPPPFSQESLDRDLKVLKDYYASKGFLDARVALLDLNVPPSGEAQLLIHVDEGQLYRLGEASFRVDEALSEEEARAIAGVRSGARADPGALEQARIRLLRELEKRGHIDAEVAYGTVRHPARAVLDVEYRVRVEKPVRFGRTVVSGNARTQTKVIRRELTFREGEPWNYQEVLRSRQRLYRLGFFQRVNIKALPDISRDGTRDVAVEVEEQDAGSVTFGFGYGREEKFKGFASISHVNLLGSGRSVELRGQFDDLDESYAVNFREPWLFNRRNDLRLSLVKSFQDRKTFNLSSVGFQASLQKEVTEQIRGSILYTLESNRLSSVEDEAILTNDDVGTYRLSAVGPVLVWDSRDDPFSPTRGFYHTFQLEWATDLLGSEVTYQRYQGRVSGYFTAGKLTLALLARGGAAVKLGGTAELPLNKRFFLGGRTTVRGFPRDELGPLTQDGDPIGGDFMVNYKAELRFPLWKQLGGAVFWDAGNVWNRRLGDDPDPTDVRHAAGFGVRYLTPVGPLTLDVGFNPDPRRDEDSWQWYFTVGNVF